MVDKLTSLVSRIFFTVAMIFIAVAVIDWIIRLFGWTFSWLPYEPGRLFELSATLLILVAVMLLRQIREAVRK